VGHIEPNHGGWDHRGGDSDWVASQEHSQGEWSLECCVCSLKEWRKPSCEEVTQLEHYSSSQGHQMKAFLPLHVLQLTLFLLSFPICSILTDLVSGVFEPWLSLPHNIPCSVGLQCESPELLFAHVMQPFCPHNLFFLDCPGDGGSRLL